MSTAATHRTPDSLAWFKSSYSGSQGGDCLEVATTPTTIHIRDSKNTPGPALAVSPATWTRFLDGIAR
ncbi:DUF397 domain-containing protein [Streptomyces sp. NPDC046870]|uniref:DUF397 domain-containing protein n=1 Tax=Streptomyces sp. NPDC046870 TaxID=3155135 RepID=UPI003453D3D2